MKNRFDLEQEIMHCWNVVDDINLLYEKVNNLPHFDSQDDVANFLLGLKTIYTHKFERLFQTFEDCLAKKEFKNERDY